MAGNIYKREVLWFNEYIYCFKGEKMIILLVLLLALFSAGAFLFYKKSKKMKNGSSAFIWTAVGILLFSIGLEISLFNVNFYTTKVLNEISLNAYIDEYKTPEGLYAIPSNSNIEFAGINQEIRTLKIGAYPSDSKNFDITVFVTDKANKNYYSLPKRTIYTEVEKSHYMNINTSGTTENLAITFKSDVEEIYIDGISVNAPRPFEFSLLRVAVLSAILCLLYVFAPSSNLYKRKVSEHKELTKSLIGSAMCIELAVIMILGTLNPTFWGLERANNLLGFAAVPLSMSHHNQYDELAQAFLEGKVYIDDDDVPQSLIDMENPYDSTERSLQSQNSGDSYPWDVAYYDGHYYVYFGIVPLLIMYLPFRIIFDSPFPSAVGIMIFSAIFALGVFKLLEFLCKKKFKNVSVGTFLLVGLTFINCCGMTFLCKRPDFYSVPIITAMAFVVWGIFFWLKGLWGAENKRIFFLLGSLCCALAVGCRPQSLLMSAAALPIFIPYFFKEKNIKKKSGIGDLVFLALPYLVVGGVIMYYNYIRFDSPFDFGSGYNLTTNDVSARGFNMGRTGLGLFTYLLQLPVFKATFPFIEAAKISTNYMGKTVYEYCFGGIFASLPLLWFIFTLKSAKPALKKQSSFSLVATLLLIGVATVVLNTQAGGLLQRYYSDFGYIFFLAAALVIFSLYCGEKGKIHTKPLNKAVYFLSLISIFYSVALAFSASDVTIDTQNPSVFGSIMHLVEFWT